MLPTYCFNNFRPVINCTPIIFAYVYTKTACWWREQSYSLVNALLAVIRPSVAKQGRKDTTHDQAQVAQHWRPTLPSSVGSCRRTSDGPSKWPVSRHGITNITTLGAYSNLCRQHFAQRKALVSLFQLLRGRFWRFSPHSGNTLHWWECQVSPIGTAQFTEIQLNFGI